jgi:RNA polymerase sigma-70 factor (ECF subfamily)
VQPVQVKPATRLERVYRDHGERMWRAVFAFCGDAEVASDAVAEAFAQALRRGEALRDPARWTWRVAFKIARGELKRRRRALPLEPARLPGVEEEVMDLIAGLRRLSPKQRTALVLHHGAGFPVREVAAIIGSTAAAVRVHLSRGRRRLQDLLEDDHA